ncbi:ribonuclease P protein component [Bosea caraganae]|uniref:Ribonuclease P protein component n=1 Tax=Bosea caraganae TaxID=2763117 RepID=A0A370L8R4_9HYPH|nr:ribonuclease P protein component [Bosea caraganae]RDJ26788.1 ribonuclease P protein component [Bosea caraganae]RDJ30674.1 ribonuclease P protein component [Bosea caraganae]
MAASASRPEQQARDHRAPFPEDWPIAMRLARLTERREFLAAAAHGRRFRSSAFTAQVRDAGGEDGRDGLRLGLTASRKVGDAVERNRIRRRLREAAKAALADQTARDVDLVVVARRECLTTDFKTLIADLSVALDRARPVKPGRKPSDPRRAPAGSARPQSK